MALSISSSESRNSIASGLSRGNTPQDSSPIFYYITDRNALKRESLISAVRRTVSWGIDFLQIREKDLSDGDLFGLTQRVVELVGGTGCRVLVNGRADLALAAGAHGVHLPANGIRAEYLATWLPKDFLIGASAHSLREARMAVREGVDYLLLGPIFPTPSKIRFGSPLGLAGFQRMCSELSIPILGLGGIHTETVPAVLEAGAAGIAGITLFQQDLKSQRISRIELIRRSSPNRRDANP